MAGSVPASVRSVAPGSDPLVPFQRPEPPEPEAIMAYYERSRREGFYSNGGPNARLLTDAWRTTSAAARSRSRSPMPPSA